VLSRLADEAEARNVLSCLGIVFDANADHRAKLDSIANALIASGFDIDIKKLDQNGIYTAGNLPMGIFISSGNGHSGRIETMILKEVTDSTVQSCVKSFAQCVKQEGGREIDEKGLVQAYLGTHNALHGIAVAFEKKIRH
jgi:hypothetical protein